MEMADLYCAGWHQVGKMYLFGEEKGQICFPNASYNFCCLPSI